MRLDHYTLKDDSLTHQVRFLKIGNQYDVVVSCNCLKNPDGSHDHMGTTKSIKESRRHYNNPDNHRAKFTDEDVAKW